MNVAATIPCIMICSRVLIACLMLFIGTFSQADQEQSTAHWDVSQLPEPTKTLSFTVSSGTWMSVDVSPDGQILVFDLLGDIYVMPITGGQAKAIATGPALQIQPRFSPDGQRIAYTSDQGGANNIWLMNQDGSQQRPISSESYQLVNNPSWTPDGQYIVARKHFTGPRSMGAGEMWQYHVGSGEQQGGVQLTQRPNQQLDRNEPQFSPDGRYLFFSVDSSPGNTFKYNKNANQQIYQIHRMDLTTGQVVKLIRGAGGASNPRVSPDGKFIAFVRRVKAKSVLYLYRQDNGAHIPLYDGLDHDQQEAWSIFGTYPGMSWTPDSKQIIFWAGGKLWKQAIQTGRRQEIPFQASVNQTIGQAPRFQQNLDTDHFTAKMLSTGITTPDNKQLIFQAAGYLWRKNLAGGKPQRLSKSTELLEYQPHISPDGKWLVYSSWSDEHYGHIYKVKLSHRKNQRHGKPQRLTRVPGYYHRPRFSPDGSKIVFRKSRGGKLLGNLHGINTGLYWMTSDGDESHFIRSDGQQAYFNATGDRIFFKTDKTYNSVDLSNANERIHFELEMLTQIVPSPDNQWLAFVESYHAYVTPFPKTGIPFLLSHKNTKIPLARLSEVSATDLHWSADSKNLNWFSGVQHVSINLAEAWPHKNQKPWSKAKSVAVNLVLKNHKPSGLIAFKNAQIITMNSQQIIDRGTIVIKENKIIDVGPANQVSIPKKATIIDASGKTIMPGLVDVHAHCIHGGGPYPHTNWAYYANLAFGVTTIHDPSANTAGVFSQSERIKSGEIIGPRVFSTGTILYGAKSRYSAIVNSLDDARRHIQRMKNVGAFTVKSYNQPRREQRQQILQAAREQKMLTIPEGGSTFMWELTMLIDGHPGIEHAAPIAPFYEDVIQLWAQTDVHYTPALPSAFGGVGGDYYFYQHDKIWQHQRLLQFFPTNSVYSRARRSQMLVEDDYHVLTIAKTLKDMAEAGVRINMGSHGQMQGLGSHWDLWLMAMGGMEPMDVLQIGTLNGARYLGLDKHIGSLEKGKLADLIVLAENPLENIRHTELVDYVMVNGRLFDAETMNEVGNHPQKRPPFYWERAFNNEDFFGTSPWDNHTHH